MSKKRSDLTVVSDVAALQVLALFEESLGLLEQHSDLGLETTARVPALPFSSLLDQCEALLQAGPAQSGFAALLRAMPGVPAVMPDWWSAHFAGLVVRQLTGADAGDAGFAAWLAALRAQGVPVVLTGGVDVALPQGLTLDTTTLVVCHPYRAFQALPQDSTTTLAEYCSGVIKALDAVQDLMPVRLEQLENPATDLCAALGLPATVTGLFTPWQDRPVARPVPPCFEGGEAYDTLCARLGYDKTALAGAAVAQTGAVRARYQVDNGARRSESPAVITAFLERAAQVRHALDPAAGIFDASAIVVTLDACAARDNEEFLDLFDTATDQLSDSDAALACLAAGAHFFAQGERVSALNFIANALMFAPREASWLRVLAAAAYADMNESKSAVMALASDALAPGVLDNQTREKLGNVVAVTIGDKGQEHGHVLLMDALRKAPPHGAGSAGVMIEIGTTRELVLGQGSTQKLAEMCAEYGLHFITVDMDPRNTRNAARMFAREGFDFQAVTAKGEDYLAQYDGVIDYVFLDAYDFDHGNHSEVRQDRYQKFLGGRIEEEQCHKMHLDCAEALLCKMAPDGLICFDDTWTAPGGAWTAKGTTAMPYLLENGFELLEARNNAALLRFVPSDD